MTLQPFLLSIIYEIKCNQNVQPIEAALRNSRLGVEALKDESEPSRVIRPSSLESNHLKLSVESSQAIFSSRVESDKFWRVILSREHRSMLWCCYGVTTNLYIIYILCAIHYDNF